MEPQHFFCVSEISVCTIKKANPAGPGGEVFLLWGGSRGIYGRYIPHKTF